MPGANILIESIDLQNLLSFGPHGISIPLGPLNVLIGANSSGKSNVIEAMSLLRGCTDDLAAVLRAGGGVNEWLWKGLKELPVASIKTSVPYAIESKRLVHELSFTMTGQKFELLKELVLDMTRTRPDSLTETILYAYREGSATIIAPQGGGFLGQKSEERVPQEFPVEKARTNDSVLAQPLASQWYPEMAHLRQLYAQIALYREWNLGRDTPSRRPQPTDLPADALQSDGGNLALVLNDFEHHGDAKEALLKRLREFCPSINNVSTKVYGGTIQVFVHESDLRYPIPATRLSDGTLRYLCLLAVLCHPSPPPLICIEEPELGMHPDILPVIAELLREASQRSQLVVTTHSDILVDALTDTPEAVLVCEKQDGATTVRRLEREPLKKWLAEYSLGQLMLRGDLGGMRW